MRVVVIVVFIICKRKQNIFKTITKLTKQRILDIIVRCEVLLCIM